MVSLTRVEDIFQEKELREGIVRFDSIQSIKLLKVHLTFDYQREILSNFSYEFKKRILYCIRGESGIGKSTILQLLCGMLIPSQGVVCINDISIDNIDGEYFRQKNISIVEQNPIFYYNTLKENILMGCSSVPNEQIFAVMERVNLIDLVSNQEADLEKPISSLNNSLSGGELYRLAIARLILQNREICLFDKPTAALDNKNRILVFKILETLAKEKMVIVVSHDNDLMQIAHKIIDLSVAYSK